ncbi:hypothetical protein BCR34DRAFT_538353 [Clohesyomyces aquaticus]|uniref:Fungal N-terminal domain-containing protein n=1 Tax=Clohesyomyces aquaticus TaxID=1231657 RepID=A0A1Y1ZMK6_9PLEO|nr:hypothetical protein BCR34DRAFT_538353 [Clohesyomyces aquaticus]
MSFGVSPSDVIKLVEFSSRLYIAFKDANDNSESQVEALIKEFSTFHHCLCQLDELMREYGKPLPFPYLDFKETLQKCQQTLKPYSDHLVDNRKMTLKRFGYTIRYIGKETEFDRLRKQITGHYQALQMCISFLQLRLHLESTKQTQRLLDSAPQRSISFGGQVYTTNAIGGSSVPNRNALPPPSEADQLYRDWLIFNKWLRNEDERIARESGSGPRPLSYGQTPALMASEDAETAAVLYRLQREIEDAITIEENRAKRVAVEKRTNLSPSDAIRREVRDMPQVPGRTFTLDSDMSLSAFDINPMAYSDATIRPTSIQSPPVSPMGSPRIEIGQFTSINWNDHSPDLSRTSSLSSGRGSFSSTGLDARLTSSSPSTAQTTPADRPLKPRFSTSSLTTLALGDGALEWNSLCRKVQVERNTGRLTESRICDIHWRYREDHGLSIRSVYKDPKTKKVQVWIAQHFPATGPSIPLSTAYGDGEVSIDFPRSSFGRLDKGCTDIKYTLADESASGKLQTLLYSNNGKDRVTLLFDRPILTISSDKNKPECRGKNLRLWRRTETHDDLEGTMSVDVLVVLFYTSALAEDRAHWVEEPHYAFEWLDEGVYKKSSSTLKLPFSKEPGKWTRQKLFKGRKSSSSTATETPTGLSRVNTSTSIASSSAFSIRSSRSELFGPPNRTNNLNRFGYSKLEVEFRSKKDRKDFVDIWRQFVKPMGFID